MPSVQLKRNRLPVKVQPDVCSRRRSKKVPDRCPRRYDGRSSAVSCGCCPPLDSGGRSAIILIKFAPCLLTGVIAAAPFGRRPRVAAGWLDSGVCASRRRARLRYWSTPAMCWKIPPRGSPYKFVSLRRREGRRRDCLSELSLPCAGSGDPRRDAVCRQQYTGPPLHPQAAPKSSGGAGAVGPGPAAEAHPAPDPAGAAGPMPVSPRPALDTAAAPCAMLRPINGESPVF